MFAGRGFVSPVFEPVAPTAAEARVGRPFSHTTPKLTVPTGREYIPAVVKRGDSSAGAAYREKEIL